VISDEEFSKVATAVAVLGAQFGANQVATLAFQKDMRQAVDEIKARLDTKINGRLDSHAQMITDNGKAIASLLATERATAKAPSSGRAAVVGGGMTFTINPDVKTLLAIFGALAVLVASLLKGGLL